MTAHQSVQPTPVSLLERLREQPEQRDWDRFVEIYAPVIYGWARRRGLQAEDAADVSQDVLAELVESLASWRKQGRFRDWLWTVTRNKVIDFWRAAQRREQATGDSAILKLMEQLESPDGDPQRDWDQAYTDEVVTQTLEALKSDFSERTWQAFERVVLEGQSPKEASAQLGISLNAVYVAKSRVLAALRKELEGLME